MRKLTHAFALITPFSLPTWLSGGSYQARISEGRLGAYIRGERSIPDCERWVADLSSSAGARFDGFDPRVLRGIAACRCGAPPDLVAKYMDWKEFEGFCAALLSAVGYRVTQNIILNNPRAQIDILARGLSTALLVDCKHWTRSGGASALARASKAQWDRAGRLRVAMPGIEPMAVVLVSLAEERTRFVGGAAVVPVHTLGDFSDNVAGYLQYLTLR